MRDKGGKTEGSAALEAVVALPILALLTWGMTEMIQLYQRQLRLDYACFCAARTAITRMDREDWVKTAEKAAARCMPGLWHNPRLSKPEKEGFRLGDPVTLELHETRSLFGRWQGKTLIAQCTLRAEADTDARHHPVSE